MNISAICETLCPRLPAYNLHGGQVRDFVADKLKTKKKLPRRHKATKNFLECLLQYELVFNAGEKIFEKFIYLQKLFLLISLKFQFFDQSFLFFHLIRAD